MNWLPDARTVAIVANPDFSATVLIDTDTGAARQFPTFVQLGSWSADGSLVAWEAERDQPPAIHVAAVADLSGERVVSAPTLRANAPRFTPTGDRLVYVQQSPTPDGTDGDIVIVGVDGLGRRTIVGGATNIAPAISPDGASVAFIRSTAIDLTECCGSNEADIYLVDIEGSGEPRLVGTSVGDWNTLIWSPDGALLATFNLPSDRLIVMALDPTIPPVEIASPGNVGTVSWQARR